MKPEAVKRKDCPQYSKKNSVENVNRQISNVCPTRTVWPIQKTKIQNEIVSGNREAMISDFKSTLPPSYGDRKAIFNNEGVKGLLKTSPDSDMQLMAMIMSRLRYGVTNTLFHDLAVGIHSALTHPSGENSFYEVNRTYDPEKKAILKTGGLKSI